jgi:choline dehydrogenase-like flavoprotein
MDSWNVTVSPQHTLATEFGFDSDEYWEEYMKRYGLTLYHPVGTCRMGKAGDADAVVDSHLRVLGVDNLRIADASIMPEISSGNTNSPTGVIGMKMAEILMKEKEEETCATRE